MKTRSLLAALSAGVLAFGVAACGGGDDDSSSSSSSGGGGSTQASTSGPKLSGSIAGAGASSQAAAMEAWIAGFQEANSDANVTYDPVGSGGGREQFVAGGTDFAGSDAHLADEELTGAQTRCGGENNLIEIPAYVSPIAIIYNLDGVEGLQLSPNVLAQIFSGKITQWDDPAIKADNPDAELPGDRIAVVHRSDESGTTENFQDYLSQVASSDWTFEVSGDWPVKGQEAAQGTSGVVSAVKNGSGTIGYADASQAGELGKAKIKVGANFVEPTPEAAAKILEESPETDDPGQHVFTYDLARQTEAEGTYPIVLVSYEIACTTYDNASKTNLVKGFLNYIISPEGQGAAAQNAGSAPLSDAIRTKIQPSIEAIGQA